MSPGEAIPRLEWIRPPVQGRSQATLRKLLDATERLVEERPFEQVSVQDVVARAHSSVGSFYARFASKEALLHSLQERYVTESKATADRALTAELWSSVPLEHVVESLCSFMVAYQRDHRGLRRALLSGMVRNAELRARAIDLTCYVTARIAALLELRRGEFSHADPARAADFMHRIIFAVLDQLLIFGDESPTGRDWTDAELAAELARACTAYLGIAPEPTRKRARRSHRKRGQQ